MSLLQGRDWRRVFQVRIDTAGFATGEHVPESVISTQMAKLQSQASSRQNSQTRHLFRAEFSALDLILGDKSELEGSAACPWFHV